MPLIRLAGVLLYSSDMMKCVLPGRLSLASQVLADSNVVSMSQFPIVIAAVGGFLIVTAAVGGFRIGSAAFICYTYVLQNRFHTAWSMFSYASSFSDLRK